MNPRPKKLLLAFGTRPELIKLAPIIEELKAIGLRDSVLILNTHQHDELLQPHLDFWNVEVDVHLDIRRGGAQLSFQVSEAISQLQEVLDDYPSLEYVMVQGDTNTAMAISCVAFYNRKKLLHVEAGLRTHQLYNPFPEEFNRIVASKVAHFHFAPTERAKINLLAEGISPKNIQVVGNTVVDSMQYVERSLGISPAESRNRVLVTLHRREASMDSYRSLAQTVAELKNTHPALEITWVSHPNYADETQEILASFSDIEVSPFLPYLEFFKLYSSAALVITDSGGVTEESVQLGIPVVVFRDFTERIEPTGSEIPFLISKAQEEILSFAATHLHTQSQPSNVYGDGKSAQRIVRWLENELFEAGPSYDTVIIGGGPAGTGLLMKAMKDGELEPLLNLGICLIEKSDTLVAGNLPEFRVNSDTYSKVFLECLEGSTGDYLDLDKLKEELAEFDEFADRSIPLPLTRKFLEGVGDQLHGILQAHSQSDVKLRTEILKIQVNDTGNYTLFTSDHQKIQADRVVIAVGGKPAFGHLCPSRLDQTAHSDEILRGKKDPLLTGLPSQNSKVVIAGGSHSAFSVVDYLLTHFPEKFSAEFPIEVWANESPKIYFPTAEEASENGYEEFTEADICPVTQRLFRLAGLRMDGRARYMDMLGMNGGPAENRAVFSQIDPHSDDFSQAMEASDLLIEATGYTFNTPSFFNTDHHRIEFQGEITRHWVDDQCRMLTQEGEALLGVYGVGLASGFLPGTELGGEPSFRGQTNGLWYYQNLIADLILQQIQKDALPVPDPKC
ncbi:non-hydrolyzing UDP-N-acetylglucosamine 2-epimerase [Pontibacter sp. G13]|uniref:non-hydrolyzing UDP-N-acetylglucosamine 2-epimerase n=1 Tax=Pontibacter sp. G13 TaxID=3074898 RepID=UPI0028894CDE|nr:UDP-N-acetylglucosamine 2-epimerase (non-hydrolyzing) [Pontibacter sp. G13]WNJ19039.1 UDP-N-acetylglucosamine 2-epimerase (non-hydrolyzing) [Pontibacter sp. G13]